MLNIAIATTRPRGSTKWMAYRWNRSQKEEHTHLHVCDNFDLESRLQKYAWKYRSPQVNRHRFPCSPLACLWCLTKARIVLQLFNTLKRDYVRSIDSSLGLQSTNIIISIVAHLQLAIQKFFMEAAYLKPNGFSCSIFIQPEIGEITHSTRCKL